MAEKNLVDIIEITDRLSNILLLTLIVLQRITGQSEDEVLADIKAKSAETDELLLKLR